MAASLIVWLTCCLDRGPMLRAASVPGVSVVFVASARIVEPMIWGQEGEFALVGYVTWEWFHVRT